MTDMILLSEAQMARISLFFPLSRRMPRVDDRWMIRECLNLCVSDRANAIFRYSQASKRPANIMAS